MAESRDALRRRHPRRVDIPLLAALALGGLLYSVQMPALEFESLFGDETFSVLTGIQGFLQSGNLLLAVLLFSFSVAFPIAKLVAILVLWFGRFTAAQRRETVAWLELLGKWSLLDSFVIAVLIGAVRLGILTQAVPRPGVYLYLASILLSLSTTFLLRSLVHEPALGRRVQLGRAGLWITVPAAVLYGVGLSLPLLDVAKGWFWDHRYSLLEGLGHMLANGDVALAGAIGLFVVVIPTVRFAGLVLLRVLGPRDSRLVAGLLLIDLWSMVDVFVLAMLVVFSKIGALADAEPLLGMWLLFGAALLTGVDSVLLQRARWRRAGGGAA